MTRTAIPIASSTTTVRKTGILTLLAVSMPVCFVGCSQYELTIYRDDYINTGVQGNLASRETKTGEPLEVNVVCVYPENLKRNENTQLRPGSGITSREWFQNKPQTGDTAEMANRGGRFWLPQDQIHLLASDPQAFGVLHGPKIRGSRYDPNPVITFDFKGPRSSKDSVIYVFGKFADPDGNTMPVRPAVFHPPGNYKQKIAVRIGVDERRSGGANYNQFIDVEGVSTE